MNLHEYQGKALFADYGLPVSTGHAVDSAEAAIKAAKDIGGGRWVVKAQVLFPDAESSTLRFLCLCQFALSL